MKYLFALCCFLASALVLPALDAADWHTDFEKAKAESLKTKRPIYILFTNSDAAPDRSLDRTIFSQRKFQDYADKKLVLMKVDFPNASHLQPKSLFQQNRELRTEYGISILPTALLLDANGKIYIDFLKADGSQEKHRRKMNEIMDFDPPKRYTEYLDGFVKKYTNRIPIVHLKDYIKKGQPKNMYKLIGIEEEESEGSDEESEESGKDAERWFIMLMKTKWRFLYRLLPSVKHRFLV